MKIVFEKSVFFKCFAWDVANTNSNFAPSGKSIKIKYQVKVSSGLVLAATNFTSNVTPKNASQFLVMKSCCELRKVCQSC